jgi:hypothetical protein
MRPEQLLALQNVCYSQEDLQNIWDNPAPFNFSKKHEAWVTMCVAKEGADKLLWTACVRLANPVRRNFKSSALWTTHERIKARNMLYDQLDGVGSFLGEEEFTSKKGMHLNKRLTEEERDVVFRPHILGS